MSNIPHEDLSSLRPFTPVCRAHVNLDFAFGMNPTIFNPIAGKDQFVEAVELSHRQADPLVGGNFAYRCNKVPHKTNKASSSLCGIDLDQMGLRLIERVGPTEPSCPLRPESDRFAIPPRFGAKSQKTNLTN
jgi:hypothetical protein